MNNDLRVKLASFEGPLDLLLYLIQKDEIDIKNVKISEITDQYLRHLDLMREYNLDVAGDFLLMASTLILIKSRSLLPNQEELLVEGDEIQTQEELMRRLMEHQRYRAMAMDFKQMPLLGHDFFKRPMPEEKQKREQMLKEMNLTDLTVAFQQMLLRARRPTIKMKKDPITILDAVKRITSRLAEKDITEFQSLFGESPERNDVVVTFLAILELGRLGKVRVLQHIAYGTIYVVTRESLSSVVQLFENGDAYAY